jgi:hypothetical protein
VTNLVIAMTRFVKNDVAGVCCREFFAGKKLLKRNDEYPCSNFYGGNVNYR